MNCIYQPSNKKTEQFIERATIVHGDIYDYSTSEYVNTYTKVKIICPFHGVFLQEPKSHLKGCGCKLCGEVKRQKSSSFSLQDFVSRAKSVHGDQYDYSSVQYHNNKTAVTIICPIHGHFSQLPGTHLRGSGCKRCADDRISLSFEQFKQKAKAVHNNKYQYDEYHRNDGKINIICPVHGEFSQLAGNHLQGSGCPKCSNVVSSPESELVNTIQKLGEFVIQRNVRDVIPPHELDLYFPELSLAIEYDGIRWHSELFGKKRTYHLHKTTACNKMGVRLIHIFESEWNKQKDLVISRLGAVLGLSERIFARKCEVVTITAKDAQDFFNVNHLQQFRSARLYIGLAYHEHLVALMALGAPRFTNQHDWEIIRYCSIRNHVVVGGASKIFSWFVQNHHPNSVVSYSDKRWNTGLLYKQLGFQYQHTSSPNYFYFKNNSTELLSRHQFQKHKLRSKLESFDPNLSEWENMVNNGYNRIWDCGNDVFIWRAA